MVFIFSRAKITLELHQISTEIFSKIALCLVALMGTGTIENNVISIVTQFSVSHKCKPDLRSCIFLPLMVGQTSVDYVCMLYVLICCYMISCLDIYANKQVYYI